MSEERLQTLPAPAPERWEAIKELFLQVIETPAEQRDLILGRASDPKLAEEVRMLVESHDGAVGFFDRLRISIGVLDRREVEFVPGETLNERFRILRFVASGGMGQVYEAEDLQLGGRLALKVLRVDIAEWPGAIERFHQEIRLARTINNPHVCRVFDVARHQRQGAPPAVFFTMEFLDGETLAQKLRREGPVPPDEARIILAQVAVGLRSAHDAGVLHCDLKPGNIMLCGERVVITDFGLAHQAAPDSAPSESSLIGGTPAYAAPEQILHQPETVSTDVYSLGVVAYEMITGQLPFQGASLREIERKRLEAMPLPPRKIRPDIPAAWDRAIVRCLNRLPEGRYASASDFAAAIGCFEKRSSSRRYFLWVSAAAGIAAPVVLFWRPSVKPNAGVVIAIRAFSSDAALQYVADGTADRLTDLLGRLPGVRVISRGASERAAKRSAGLADIAAPHTNPHLLTGDVHGSAGEIRFHLALSDLATQAQVWSSTYTVRRDEMEAVPPAAIRAIVHSLRIDLAPAQLQAANTTLTSSGEAYQLYLLGRYYAAMRTKESLKESIEFLRRCVTIDPRFAMAHAALAFAQFDYGLNDRVSLPEYTAMARLSVERALAIQQDCAEAFFVRGFIAHFIDWNWKAAEANYRRAVELDPSSVQARQWYGRMLCARRRFSEAERQFETSLTLDPFEPALLIARGINLTYSGRSEEAVRLLRLVAAEHPEHTNVFSPLSCALEESGKLEEAVRAAELGSRLTGRKTFILSQLGHMYALIGRDADARNILNELIAQQPIGGASSAEVAAVYSGWRDTENTLLWLERATARRERGLLLLGVDPQLNFLRHNTRFQAILSKVHPDL